MHQKPPSPGSPAFWLLRWPKLTSQARRPRPIQDGALEEIPNADLACQAGYPSAWTEGALNSSLPCPQAWWVLRATHGSSLTREPSVLGLGVLSGFQPPLPFSLCSGPPSVPDLGPLCTQPPVSPFLQRLTLPPVIIMIILMITKSSRPVNSAVGTPPHGTLPSDRIGTCFTDAETEVHPPKL